MPLLLAQESAIVVRDRDASISCLVTRPTLPTASRGDADYLTVDLQLPGTPPAAVLAGLPATLSSLEDLTTVTQSRLGSFLNALRDHLTDSDIGGIVKNAAGIQTGEADHLMELQSSLESAQNLAKSLSGRLANPSLSADQRLATLDALHKLNQFIKYAQDVLGSAK